MPKTQNAVGAIIKAAGGRGPLSKALEVTFQAVFEWERRGYMPLARAKQVMDMYPGVASLRDLVRDDLRAAMDISTQEALLD